MLIKNWLTIVKETIKRKESDIERTQHVNILIHYFEISVKYEENEIY